VKAGWCLALLLVTAPLRAADAPRIVSLAPSLTEIAFAAGAGAMLVGTVEYSDFPAAARALPRVGDGWSVDVERVLALRPDIVLAWSSGTPEATIARLRSVRLRVVTVPTFRLADVPAALRLVGDLAGTQPVADAAAVQFEDEIRRLRTRHAGAPPVTVFVQIDDEPLFTVNGRHIISEMLALCGGSNVFADLPQVAPTVDIEAVLARNPQVILSTDDTIADPQSAWRRWPQLAAVRAGAIYSMPADTVTRATPRVVDGVRSVCGALDDARRRIRSLSAPMAPEHLDAVLVPRQHARDHEQQVGEPVQVAGHFGGHVLRTGEGPHATLGPPRHRAGEVAGRGGGAAARQDEVLEGRQVCVETVEHLLQPVHVLIGDHAVAGHAEFPAQVEQVVLHVGEAIDDGLRQAGHGEHDAHRAVRFVHGSVGLDAQVFLRHPHAVAQPRAAVVAGARVDPAQSVAHVCSWRGWRTPAEYASRDAGA